MNGAFARKLLVDQRGSVHLLAEAPGPIRVGTAEGTGTFVARLSPNSTRSTGCTFVAGASDFGLDTNGEFVVLTKGKVTRYAADGQTEKWSAGFKSHGDNRAGGVAVSPTTGVAAVTGYGMTHTGKEPYKDPYAYGFSRDGRQLWQLWNPDPKLQQAAKFGGNGLMADTSGHFAAATAGGKLLLTLFADGGNSVCTRDPADPSTPLASEVFDGVFQKSAGHGFKGASKQWRSRASS
jgi:hypothetical protein